MRRVRRALFLVSLGCLLAGSALGQSDGSYTAAKTSAQDAAESWLALVDDDDFGESWDDAASLLQNRIAREDWIAEGRTLRDSVDVHSYRARTTVQYRDSIRRAPNGGPFVLLKYHTTFKTGRVEELIVTVREEDTWKVAGYQVTPLQNAARPSSPRGRPSNP